MKNRLVPKWIKWRLFRGRIKVTSTIASHSPLNISETQLYNFRARHHSFPLLHNYSAMITVISSLACYFIISILTVSSIIMISQHDSVHYCTTMRCVIWVNFLYSVLITANDSLKLTSSNTGLKVVNDANTTTSLRTSQPFVERAAFAVNTCG